MEFHGEDLSTALDFNCLIMMINLNSRKTFYFEPKSLLNIIKKRALLLKNIATLSNSKIFYTAANQLKKVVSSTCNVTKLATLELPKSIYIFLLTTAEIGCGFCWEFFVQEIELLS